MPATAAAGREANARDHFMAPFYPLANVPTKRTAPRSNSSSSGHFGCVPCPGPAGQGRMNRADMSDSSTYRNTSESDRPAGSDRAEAGVEQYGYKQELHRSLIFGDLLVYGLVFMVPIAPFGIFGGVFNGSGGMVALAYIIGMVAMMFTALSYAQMSQAFPMAGSVYTYAGRGIAAPVGFLSGWMILLDYVLVPGLLYLIASVAMHSLIPA